MKLTKREEKFNLKCSFLRSSFPQVKCLSLFVFLSWRFLWKTNICWNHHECEMHFKCFLGLSMFIFYGFLCEKPKVLLQLSATKTTCSIFVLLCFASCFAFLYIYGVSMSLPRIYHKNRNELKLPTSSFAIQMNRFPKCCYCL
jgi:hypothetical protein